MKHPTDKPVEPLLVSRRARGKRARVSRRVLPALCKVGAGLAALLLGCWVLSVVLRPFLLDRQEVKDIRRLQAAVAQTESANKALRQRLRVLNTNKGIEVEARRLGWVRSGEILIQTSSLPRPAQAEAAADTPPALGAVGRQAGILRRTLAEVSQTLNHISRHFDDPEKPAKSSRE